ncbi:hypothetical protein KY366_02530 [Candidatus Woesearchaeota archaeon]|nr:hypothetical protein [Candidatus Woesearchaeota archaeon]
MGLLNHIFGDKKDIAKELAVDNEKCIPLWEQHISNWKQREQLCKKFSPANMRKAPPASNEILPILEKIESLISPDLITIGDEKKLEEEILDDMGRLKEIKEIESLSQIFLYEKRKKEALVKLFGETYDVLEIELHLIELIKEWPPNVEKLLKHLFKLIFYHEDELYKPFRKELFNKSTNEAISRFVRAVLLQEELKEEIESEEEKFARDISEKMREGSKHHYRRLGEDIFSELVDRVQLLRSEDITEGIKRLEDLIENDDLLYKMIKKLRPRYADVKIRAVILAFRKAFNMGEFEESTQEFST